MREILPTVLAALSAGERVGLAVVVRTWSSAPCPAGTAMAVTADGAVVGSVSGGCVEGAVYDQCREVLAGGDPQRTRYGVTDDDAFAVGLACGGTLEVAVVRLDPAVLPVVTAVSDAVARYRPVTLALPLPPDTAGESERRREDREAGPADREGRQEGLLAVLAEVAVGSLGTGDLDRWVRAEAARRADSDDAVVLTAPGFDASPALDGAAVPTGIASTPAPSPSAPATSLSGDVLLVPLHPPARLVVVGAADQAVALCRFGRLLGLRVSVVDARAVFATPQRFPDADEVVVQWPARWLATAELRHRDAVCVLTHDAKVDVPALAVALRSGAGYVGALGSRRTHADRVVRLREAGVPEADIERIHAPIGLDLGARTPAETAVSILAEVVRVRRGGTGAPLAHGEGAIHPAPSQGDGAIRPDPTHGEGAIHPAPTQGEGAIHPSRP